MGRCDLEGGGTDKKVILNIILKEVCLRDLIGLS
jgi:hypothetical protein